MKPIPHEEFSGRPASNGQEKLPLSVRAMKAVINSNRLMKLGVLSAIFSTGAVVALEKYAEHDFKPTLSCKIAYNERELDKVEEVTFSTAQNSMWSVLSKCERELKNMDSMREFVSLTIDRGTILPSINGKIIQGQDESMGRISFVGIQDNDPKKSLATALEAVQNGRRYWIQEQMELSGHTISLDNLRYQWDRAGYAVSDTADKVLRDAPTWAAGVKQRAFSLVS